MKPVLKITVFILLSCSIFFIACKKDKTITGINTAPPPPPPPPTPPVFNLQLVPFGGLSQGRYMILSATAANKVLFVGGRIFTPNCYFDSTDNSWWNCEDYSTRVDVYDTLANTWSQTELPGSSYSYYNSAATAGHKIFFAGGYGNSGKVDVYDASSGSWSVIEIPHIKKDVVAGSLGNKIFFSGGEPTGIIQNRVDIYDNNTNSWSTAFLSQPRAFLRAISSGHNIFFAGGLSGGTISKVVDIYNDSTNSWTTASLSLPRYECIPTVAGTKVFFSGGQSGLPPTGQGTIDIFDNVTRTWSSVDRPGMIGYFTTASVGKRALFFTWNNINMYDGNYNIWRQYQMTELYGDRSSIAVGNKIYIAGGRGNAGGITNVWRIEF